MNTVQQPLVRKESKFDNFVLLRNSKYPTFSKLLHRHWHHFLKSHVTDFFSCCGYGQGKDCTHNFQILTILTGICIGLNCCKLPKLVMVLMVKSLHWEMIQIYLIGNTNPWIVYKIICYIQQYLNIFQGRLHWQLTLTRI